jgi:hypothetical protein
LAAPHRLPPAEVRGVKATAVTDGYDPKEKLAAGWDQLNDNVLVLVP